MRTKLPNGITLSRMLFSLVLLFVPADSYLFILLYLLCGLSDVLDGLLARRFHCASKTGALLDSIADLLFLLIVLGKLLGSLPLPDWLISWILLIFIIRSTSVLVGYVRFSAVAFLHTMANKAAGLMLFFYPLLYRWDASLILAGCVCAVALLAALEELWLLCYDQHLERDRKGIWL